MEGCIIHCVSQKGKERKHIGVAEGKVFELERCGCGQNTSAHSRTGGSLR